MTRDHLWGYGLKCYLDFVYLEKNVLYYTIVYIYIQYDTPNVPQNYPLYIQNKL